MRSLAETCGLLAVLLGVCSEALAAETGRAPQSTVRMAEEKIVLPTYEAGPPDPNPMFYTNESYQGAQRRVYPYPLQDRLTHSRKDKTYTALTLENEYVRIAVLPELGGRLFSATDKTNGYEFFYRQHVIKPALIGMLGAWISGGVEWCAFHHHRSTTFMPVDHALVENPDGSKTIWVGETERRHRMRWLVGLTLRPGNSCLEAQVKFFNRTAQPHSILYWANAAVHVNDQYQVIFPPSVQAATYHSKIDFTYWPIARGKYRGHDYAGADLSWWKNSPESNSFFAWDLREDFMGGYDHGKQAGVVHVADHHLVCGAKLWEWGTGPYGRAWDKILTDDDGPYAELMTGAWSDNQPDYSWIKPYEVKSIKQCWYPVRGIGGFKNANLRGAVNLEVRPGGAVLVGFHATSPHRGARAVLKAGRQVLLEQAIDIGPDRPFRREVPMPPGVEQTDLRASLVTAQGEELVAYRPVRRNPPAELPRPVKTPPKPAEIKTVEELCLTGVRVEQIHNPSVDPLDYYREAVKRDPGDSRANTVLAVHANKRGRHDEAESHARRAIERLSAEYTRPQNTEAYYQLGLALRAQGKLDEAYDSFYRATWDQAFHSAAFYQLAEIACRRGDFARALEHVERSLATNGWNTKALNLKAAICRTLGRAGEARAAAASVLAADPLDLWAANELRLAGGSPHDLTGSVERRMPADVQACLELATDYLGPGMWDEAIAVLQRPVREKAPFAGTYPTVYYLLGYLYEQKGQPAQAAEAYAAAGRMPGEFCFPFRAEEAAALRAALRANPADARAQCYLGNLLFDLQPEAAIAAWEASCASDPRLALAHRNLGWAQYRVKLDVGKAIECYERAIALDAGDPRLFLELDVLYESGNVPPERRLAVLEKNHATVVKRQESFAREIQVLVLAGRYDQAIEHLAASRFHAREGSERIHDVFVDAHLLRGLRRLRERNYQAALGDFEKAADYPENLSVGRPRDDPRAAQVAYCTALAWEALGKADQAREHFEKAAGGRDAPEGSDARFYQALALAKLGRNDRARKIFDGLIQAARDRLAAGQADDFFAKFGEQEAKRSRTASAHYLLGLGLMGNGETAQAKEEFQQAVKSNAAHLWARHQLSAME